jgi:hypothetical protein
MRFSARSFSEFNKAVLSASSASLSLALLTVPLMGCEYSLFKDFFKNLSGLADN